MLINNAGTSYKGYFEEMASDDIDRQLATNLLGPMNVTRAVLPVMRAQRSGHVISISSGAGLSGFEFSSIHAAAKFGLEGWMDALRREVEPFGIATTVVNPGFGCGAGSRTAHRASTTGVPSRQVPPTPTVARSDGATSARFWSSRVRSARRPTSMVAVSSSSPHWRAVPTV